MENKIKLFEDRRIRYAWDAEREEWFFSITDVVKALTNSADEKQYLKKMKMRDPSLDANWGTICTPPYFGQAELLVIYQRCRNGFPC